MKKPTKRKYTKRKKFGDPPSHLDRVSEARAALDQAHEDYIDAVTIGNAALIRTARRALMIALANYLAVTGGEASLSETEVIAE